MYTLLIGVRDRAWCLVVKVLTVTNGNRVRVLSRGIRFVSPIGRFRFIRLIVGSVPFRLDRFPSVCERTWMLEEYSARVFVS